MRQPVWLPHFLEERCDHAPISVSLWAVDAHLWRAGDGRTGLRPAGCSAALQALRTVPGQLRLPVYFGGGGAKLLYLLPLLPRLAVELPLLWEEPGEFYARYLSGGMVFYGGFFGGVAAAWGAAKYLRLRLSDFFPVLVPALPLVHAVGRVGCFCAGCCYGRAAPPPWGIAFTHAIAGPNGVPLLPVQLWEAGAELVIFAFLLWYAGRAAGPGQMLRAYVFCYAPVRFVLEWFRGDPARGMYGPLSTSQWLSLVVLALALAWPVAGRKLKKYVRERVSQQKGNRDKSDSAHS